MELNRKLIMVILVALIIIVPIVLIVWVVAGPTDLDDLAIDSVVAHEDADGVLIVASASGSGQAFEDKVDLVVKFGSEQVYSGKIQFREGYTTHKLPYEDFCKGNGEYEFRLSYGDFHPTYKMELDTVAEEIFVVSSVSYNLVNPPPGAKPYEAIYSFYAVFNTGWHYFTYDIDPNSFASYFLGSRIAGESTPLKVETEPGHGVKVDVIYESPGGAQSVFDNFTVDGGSSLSETIQFTSNGSYIFKYINQNSVPVKMRAYENRPVDKLPRGQSIDVDWQLASQSDSMTQNINEIDKVSGMFNPAFGPGNYTVTLTYENPQVMVGSSASTITYTEVTELNDKPKADASAGEPYRITTLQRTVTFDATASLDDGPKEDLWVEWFFGATSDGKYIGEGSAEGPWETHSTHTFIYPIGVNPDLTEGRPYLILRDKYGAESAVEYINLQIG